MNFVLKKIVTTQGHITVNYLHFALVSMEPKFFDNFQNKQDLNASVVMLWPHYVFRKS